MNIFVNPLKNGSPLSMSKYKWFHASKIVFRVKSKFNDKSKLPSALALNHFDDFYKNVFKEKWPSIRLGLLCPHKYCAVINPYANESKQLINMGAINLKHIFKDKSLKTSLTNEDKSLKTSLTNEDKSLEKALTNVDGIDENFDRNDENFDNTTGIEADHSRHNIDSFMPVSEIQFKEEIFPESSYNLLNQKLMTNKEIEKIITFPLAWEIFVFPKSDIRSFPHPRKDKTGYLNYFLMDGASLFPVIALDIQAGEEVADLCSAPGGKALIMAYTMCPRSLYLIDNTASRIRKLKNVIHGFLPDQSSLNTVINVTQTDGRDVPSNSFDKVLVDAPCTNDRVSVLVDDNNFFSAKRLKERVKLPDIQSELLIAGLRALKKGGSLVYSTCSLSPAQNDGVVHVALSKVLEETSMNFVVKDLRNTFEQISHFVSFDFSQNYGTLILPFLPCNFGPMYISKITRVS